MLDSERYHLFGSNGTDLLYDAGSIIFYRLTAEGRRALEQGALAPPQKAAGTAKGIEPSSPGVSASGDNGSGHFLERLVLIVTTECNLRCRYCYAEGGNYGMLPQPMPLEVAIQTIRWALAHFTSIEVIQFFGGEPSLNEKIIHAVCEALENHPSPVRPRYGMVTNGVQLSDRLRETLQRFGFRVTLSIDGPAQVHDYHRVRADGRGSFHLLWHNLGKLRADGIEVGTEMTLTPQALETGYGVWELTNFSRNHLEIGEPHIVPVCTEPANPIQWEGASVPSLVNSYRHATAACFQSFLDGRPLSFTLFSGILRTLVNRRGRDLICPAGAGTLAVDPQGDIFPCFMFAGQSEHRLGNVFDHPPDDDYLWDKLQAFIRRNHKSARPECRSCWARKLCTGCMGNVQMTTGSLENTWGLMCRVMKAIAEETMHQLAAVQQDAALWKRFVSQYRQFRLGVEYC